MTDHNPLYLLELDGNNTPEELHSVKTRDIISWLNCFLFVTIVHFQLGTAAFVSQKVHMSNYLCNLWIGLNLLTVLSLDCNVPSWIHGN